MSGYRGDGYGIHGDVGDEDFSFGDGRTGPERGAARGNLFGRAEHDAASAFFEHREGDDPRARRAADDWNRRFGREGHEGSYAQHDAYHRYREQHLAELDRDYDDWCRENEQQFHREFNDWRGSRRQVSNQPGSDAVIAEDSAADALTPTAETETPPPKSRRSRR